MNSVSVENFLKTIFTLKEDEGEKTSTSNLAERLGISGPAVTDMAKKLSVKGLVEYKPYKEIEITSEGRDIAVKVIRRHRIWEMFLHKVLELDLNEVHDEAELLEHQTSDKLLDKMDQFLGYPEVDPHGDPIPTSEGKFQNEMNVVRLSQLSEGDKVIIVRLLYAHDDVHTLFKYYNIKTSKTLRVIKIFNVEQLMQVEMDKEIVNLPLSVQKKIYCKHIEK
jgi:DtxR family Mn-dependent transcriptional regulator